MIPCVPKDLIFEDLLASNRNYRLFKGSGSLVVNLSFLHYFQIIFPVGRYLNL